MLSGTSLISVQCGVGVLTVLHLHQMSLVDAGTAALVLVDSQAAGALGRISLAAWSDRSRTGRYVIVLVCMVAVVAGPAVLMTPTRAGRRFRRLRPARLLRIRVVRPLGRLRHRSGPTGQDRRRPGSHGQRGTPHPLMGLALSLVRRLPESGSRHADFSRTEGAKRDSADPPRTRRDGTRPRAPAARGAWCAPPG